MSHIGSSVLLTSSLIPEKPCRNAKPTVESHACLSADHITKDDIWLGFLRSIVQVLFTMYALSSQVAVRDKYLIAIQTRHIIPQLQSGEKHDPKLAGSLSRVEQSDIIQLASGGAEKQAGALPMNGTNY